MVIVNTVVLVRGTLGLDDAHLAWTLAAYGLGSMIAALSVPRLLERIADRTVMVAGAALPAGGMALGPAASRSLDHAAAALGAAGLRQRAGADADRTAAAPIG